MKTVRHAVPALLLLAVCLVRAEVVDRVVAVVNRHVILQSELEQAARVEFLLNGRSLDELTPAEMQIVLGHLIDQSLLEQQVLTTAIVDPTPEELAAHSRDVRSRLPGASDDQRWQSMMSAYGVTQRDVDVQLTAQIRIARFIDLRFRSLARVDRTAVTTYYEEKFLPQLRSRGAPEPPLAEVSARIEKILVEERINDLLATWLETLRSQAQIRRMAAATGERAGGRL